MNLTLLNGVEACIGENTREQGGVFSAIDFVNVETKTENVETKIKYMWGQIESVHLSGGRGKML